MAISARVRLSSALLLMVPGLLAGPAKADDATQAELRELRTMVRKQAEAMEMLQHRLDGLESRQRGGARPQATQVAKAAEPHGPPGSTGSPPKPQGSTQTAQAAAASNTDGNESYELEAPPGFRPLTVGPYGKVPAPTDRNVAVTQQPGNLPGRSAVQPYTAANVGTPGGIAPIPAAPVAAGADRVRLTLSGQVNRMLLYGNDGRASAVRNVDNNNSSTRLRVVGEGQVSDTASGGVNIETELRPNSSASTTLTQNLPQPASATTFTVRQAEVYYQDTRYGGVRLGFGSTASYLTAEIDLSGTSVASYVFVSDFDGGFAFRQRGDAMVPVSSTKSVFSPAGAFGPAVAGVFNAMDGLSRDDRIRYDTPRIAGFQFSTSYVDGGAFDFALRYAGEFNGNQLVAGVGFADAVARNHIAATAVSGYPGAVANLYGYAGVPTGSNGTQVLGTAASPNSGDASANGSKQYDGSASLLLKNGINFTVAGGVRDTIYLDPLGKRLTPTFLFAKVGYRANLFPAVGISAISADFAQNNDLQFNGDHARSYSGAFVQNIDAAAAELFLTGRVETLRRTFADYDNLVAVALGVRVRF